MNYTIEDLHSNQKLLIYEMMSRNIDVEIIDFEKEIIKTCYQNHFEIIVDRDSSIMPYSSAVVVGDKFITKRMLKENNISVPLGVSAEANNVDFFLEAFKIFNSPVVIKPAFGSHGYDVYIDLQSEHDVKQALLKIEKNRGSNTKTIIEECFLEKEYRVFITKNKDYAVLYREPAHIVGDGKHTIKELADIETMRRLNPRTNALCPILIDKEVENLLKTRNFSLNTIPFLGEKIYLRKNSNVAMGGLCIDYTEKVHQSVIDICFEVLKTFPNLPYAGIDFMSKDISIQQRKESYRVIEVNSIPGINMHMNPAEGKSQNVAKILVDMIYPETKGESHERSI